MFITVTDACVLRALPLSSRLSFGAKICVYGRLLELFRSAFIMASGFVYRLLLLWGIKDTRDWNRAVFSK